MTEKKDVPISSSNQDLLDHLLYPFYQKVATFIPRSITPNQITIAGFLFALLSALLIGWKSIPITLPLAGITLYLYSLCDALDGIHARLTNQCSDKGSFLDHFFDNIGMSCIFFAILYRFELFVPIFVLAFFLRITVGVTSFIVQAETGDLLIPKIGPTCELFIYIALFLLFPLIPGEIDLSFLADKSELLNSFLEANKLVSPTIVSLFLLLYLPISLLSFKEHWNYAMNYFDKK